VATPNYAGDPAGKISLTSNVIDYSWVKLNDPTNYTVAEVQDMQGRNVIPELAPCP